MRRLFYLLLCIPTLFFGSGRSSQEREMLELSNSSLLNSSEVVTLYFATKQEMLTGYAVLGTRWKSHNDGQFCEVYEGRYFPAFADREVVAMIPQERIVQAYKNNLRNSVVLFGGNLSCSASLAELEKHKK